MLYGNESISHYNRSNIAIWMAMAFQAGALNIAGFMACHQFVSHITGFATMFGYEINQHDASGAVAMLIVPLFFLFGAMLSGLLVDLPLKRHKKPRYYFAFGVMFFLIMTIFLTGISGHLGTFGEPLAEVRDYFLLTLLCFTCGVQNGTITTVSKAVIRTTHLTGIVTDLGIGFVRVLNSSKLNYSDLEDRKANKMRIGIVVFFGLGAIVGGFAFQRVGYYGFLIPALTSGNLFVLMLYFQRWHHSSVAHK